MFRDIGALPQNGGVPFFIEMTLPYIYNKV